MTPEQRKVLTAALAWHQNIEKSKAVPIYRPDRDLMDAVDEYLASGQHSDPPPRCGAHDGAPSRGCILFRGHKDDHDYGKEPYL